jgi:drug/metabolite transporter (DMT)-like permease
MSMEKANLAPLAAAGAATLWAISGVVGKMLLSGSLSPGQLVFYRSALGSGLLLAGLLAQKRTLLKINLHDLPYLVLLGVLGLALTQFAYYGAIQAMSVGLAILLQYLAPLWILLYERLWIKMPLTSSKVLALVVAILGCLLVCVPTSGRPTVSSYGLLLGIASGVFFATYGLMSQRALRSYSEVTVLFYSLLFTALFWGLLSSSGWAPLVGLGNGKVWMILYVAVFGTLLPFFLFILALKHLEASQVGIITTLEPVVAATIAWIYLGDRLTVFQIAGGLLVLIAILMLRVKKAPRVFSISLLQFLI